MKWKMTQLLEEMQFTDTCMEQEGLILRCHVEGERDKYQVMSLVWNIKKHSKGVT